MDPLLVGKLVFWGQSWAFRGSRRYEFLTPEDVRESFDAIVITQSLDDHCHRPTLERIDRRMPIITNPSAAKTVQRLGYQPSTLRPGESLMLGHLCISAIPGSVVGPPWQDPENGYVFTDTRRGGWSIGTEPHGNFFGPALGTSFKRLPSAPRQPLDALILPLRAQQISGYRLVNGVQEAADTLEALDPVPRFLLPLPNAEIDASGVAFEASWPNSSRRMARWKASGNSSEKDRSCVKCACWTCHLVSQCVWKWAKTSQIRGNSA
ncbi:Uncharacterized protein SCF082_LOCUS49344 [Durusdinium trenchii]|uniref:MBL fold metallo-hydrolase n=1 Tax=Durusdinium trenchii TaxID=1381693 RepID=A0ABP0S0M2_9DINO